MWQAHRLKSCLPILVLTALLISQPVIAQISTKQPVTVPLSDVVMQLTTGGSGGCFGRCEHYRVTIRGTGGVELEDIGTPPRAETKRRAITGVEVVTLVNEFLKVRFFDAAGNFSEPDIYAQQGDSLLLRGRGGADGTHVDLTLQLGAATKTVRLYKSVPAEWERLRELLWRTGGPDAW
jgi:hypothetical protein